MIIEYIKILFCRHQMKYWDVKYMVDEEVGGYIFKQFNGRIEKKKYCQCQKCGVKKKIGLNRKWIKYEFNIPSNSYVLVEVYEFGKETKRQKRDRILSDIGIK
jgi:hypothetical protein